MELSVLLADRVASASQASDLLTSSTLLVTWQMFVSSRIASDEVPDAFHDASTAARSKSQSCTPDMCLSVNFKLNFVTLSFPCAYHFLGVSQLFRPAPCMSPTCAASGPVQPASVSRASFFQECQGISRSTCLPSLLTRCFMAEILSASTDGSDSIPSISCT